MINEKEKHMLLQCQITASLPGRSPKSLSHVGEEHVTKSLQRLPWRLNNTKITRAETNINMLDEQLTSLG